ncbi:MAG: copper amine oxidase N-terminal domain-containing protein, partial [Peptococcaceae bacterium]|nr:copper amine oxidase N-terminal domain-containing protein [Peptococcaceae bacterium]
AKTASVAPYIKDGRTMLPIRDFAQALGSQVNWDGRNASVDIYTGGPVAAAPQIPSDVPSDMRWLVEKYYVAPTEQGVGTWYGELHWNFPVDGSEKTYNYFFISKMANGQKNAVVFTYSADTGYGPVVYMQTGSIGETAYGFDLTEVEDWKKYFYGGAMDFYGYTIWHMNYSGNDLLHTGSTRCFIDSYFTPFNDLYKRIG